MKRRKRNRCGRQIAEPEDIETITLAYQGKLLTLERRLRCDQPKLKTKRGNVTTFSRKSRLKLLKLIATVDWGKIPNSLFMTLTYPDKVDWTTCKARNKHKYLMMRFVEKHLGRPVKGVWRIEWKPRKSGECVGMIAPHYHLLLLGEVWIPWRKIREWWLKAIAWDKTVSTHVRRCQSAKKAALYVSKYVAKVDRHLNLDNGPYLNTRGRHWGVLRKGLIPRMPVVRVNDLTPDEVDFLCRKANEYLKWRQANDDNGFALLGDIANYLYTEFLIFRLANRIE